VCLPAQQGQSITAHLNPFLRAFSQFSSFISLSQLIKLGRSLRSIQLTLRLRALCLCYSTMGGQHFVLETIITIY
jgi:hypothetical protein